MVFFEKEKNKLLKDTIEFLNKKNSHITFSNEDLLFFEREIKSFFSPKKNSLKTNTPKKNPRPIPSLKQKKLTPELILLTEEMCITHITGNP